MSDLRFQINKAIKDGALVDVEPLIDTGGTAVIPDGVTTIGTRSCSCPRLQRLKIPKSVRKIMPEAFAKGARTRVTIPKGVNLEWTQDQWGKHVGAFAFANNVGQLILPKDLEEIPPGTFLWADFLRGRYTRKNTYLKIPSSVKKIGADAFKCFDGAVYIPETLNEIDPSSCVQATSVSFPSCVTSNWQDYLFEKKTAPYRKGSSGGYQYYFWGVKGIRSSDGGYLYAHYNPSENLADAGMPEDELVPLNTPEGFFLIDQYFKEGRISDDPFLYGTAKLKVAITRLCMTADDAPKPNEEMTQLYRNFIEDNLNRARALFKRYPDVVCEDMLRFLGYEL